jgi:glyoxylase-like metal-dependent hydrolase (beta-lactamase superfamily II)
MLGRSRQGDGSAPGAESPARDRLDGPLEIAPGVYEIALTRVRVHVIAEARLTLIDAGLVRSGPRIERGIAALGRSIDELARIVCTHCHPDHAGGALELLRDDVELLMHPADLARVGVTAGQALRSPSRGRLFAAMTPAPSHAVPINDGDVLPVLGGLQVIHTPGHTPGSICLYAPRDGLLFVGDVLQARFGRVGFASRLYSDDYAAARASVERLADLDVETIVFGHFPPWRQDARHVLQGLAAQVKGT